jgi:hypothetical protein
VTLTTESPEAWADRWIAAVRAGTLDAFLAADWVWYEASIAEATAAVANCPMPPATDVDRAPADGPEDELLRCGNLAALWPLTRTVNRQRRSRLDRWRFGNVPAWVPGESLRGRTLVIVPDIGLGDMIWHYRYVPLVAAGFGGRVVVEAVPALARLLRSSFHGVAEVCDEPGDILLPPMVPYDRWCLPVEPAEVFASDPKLLPAAAYLKAASVLVAHWRRVIEREAGGRFRVGLNWSGDPSIPDDQRRIPLAALAALAAVPRIELFGLQKTISIRQPSAYPVVVDSEAEPAPAGMKLTRLGPRFADMADTAAAMANLDLVITCDTSIAHLAGALGRPTWLLLPEQAWAGWGSSPETTPWYPSMRLFRQERHGDWAPVVARVAAALAGMVRWR